MTPESGDFWDDYLVTAQLHEEPAILRTCRQLRAEGVEVFRSSNFFCIEIWELKLEPQLNHWICNIYPEDHSPWWHFRGSHSRANFKQWLMYFDDQTVPRIDHPGEVELTWDIVMAQAFDIVGTLAVEGVSWAATERVIDAWLRTTQHGQWASGLLRWTN